jgi:hypothetical protein
MAAFFVSQNVDVIEGCVLHVFENAARRPNGGLRNM